MDYYQLPPDDFLKDFIRCYWWLDNSTDQDLKFSILPDGCFDLIILFKNYKQDHISLSGLWSKKTEVTVPPNTQLFGIQFRLLAVDYIFQEKIASMLNQQKNLKDDYWALDSFSLFDNDRAELVKQLDGKIYSCINSKKEIDARKQKLFKLLYQTKGNEPTDFYAQQVFWSRRQITRYFQNRFGLSLKAYCNILKCSASFKHLKKGQLYPEQNYFDQSHFIKSLKKHTGNTPKDLFENKNDRFLQLTIIPKK
ncbi:MAG: DUF6597 domain-containing transcriptional factor [Saprospiraceae bacterium]